MNNSPKICTPTYSAVDQGLCICDKEKKIERRADQVLADKQLKELFRKELKKDIVKICRENLDDRDGDAKGLKVLDDILAKKKTKSGFLPPLSTRKSRRTKADKKDYDIFDFDLDYGDEDEYLSDLGDWGGVIGGMIGGIKRGMGRGMGRGRWMGRGGRGRGREKFRGSKDDGTDDWDLGGTGMDGLGLTGKGMGTGRGRGKGWRASKDSGTGRDGRYGRGGRYGRDGRGRRDSRDVRDGIDGEDGEDGRGGKGTDIDFSAGSGFGSGWGFGSKMGEGDEMILSKYAYDDYDDYGYEKGEYRDYGDELYKESSVCLLDEPSGLLLKYLQLKRMAKKLDTRTVSKETLISKKEKATNTFFEDGYKFGFSEGHQLAYTTAPVDLEKELEKRFPTSQNRPRMKYKVQKMLTGRGGYVSGTSDDGQDSPLTLSQRPVGQMYYQDAGSMGRYYQGKGPLGMYYEVKVPARQRESYDIRRGSYSKTPVGMDYSGLLLSDSYQGIDYRKDKFRRMTTPKDDDGTDAMGRPIFPDDDDDGTGREYHDQGTEVRFPDYLDQEKKGKVIYVAANQSQIDELREIIKDVDIETAESRYFTELTDRMTAEIVDDFIEKYKIMKLKNKAPAYIRGFEQGFIDSFKQTFVYEPNDKTFNTDEKFFISEVRKMVPSDEGSIKIDQVSLLERAEDLKEQYKGLLDFDTYEKYMDKLDLAKPLRFTRSDFLFFYTRGTKKKKTKKKIKKPKVRPKSILKRSANDRAFDYLDKHKIEDIFRYMGVMLCANKPDDPIDFLIKLLEKCLLYKNNKFRNAAPLVFTEQHVESIYKNMDPFNYGYIDGKQYLYGLNLLQVAEADDLALVLNMDTVEKDLFLMNANFRLLQKFNIMIGLY